MSATCLGDISARLADIYNIADILSSSSPVVLCIEQNKLVSEYKQWSIVLKLYFIGRMSNMMMMALITSLNPAAAAAMQTFQADLNRQEERRDNQLQPSNNEQPLNEH